MTQLREVEICGTVHTRVREPGSIWLGPVGPRRCGGDMTRTMLVAAWRQGMRARIDGVSPLACPYAVRGDLTQRFCVMAWIRGYNSAAAPEAEVSGVNRP